MNRRIERFHDRAVGWWLEHVTMRHPNWHCTQCGVETHEGCVGQRDPGVGPGYGNHHWLCDECWNRKRDAERAA